MKRRGFFAFIVFLLVGPMLLFGEGGEAEWILLDGYCVQAVEMKCLEESYRVIESRSHDEHSSLPETGCPFPSGWRLTAGDLVFETLHQVLCRPSRIETMPPWK
jgi:hypothetical protein